jgi:hypothetical protein
MPRLRLLEFEEEEPIKQREGHCALASGANPQASGAEPSPSEVSNLRTSQMGYSFVVRDLPSVQGGERDSTG